MFQFLFRINYVGHKLGEFVSTRNFKTHIKADRKGKR
jgi:ribosomal protein S19